MYVALCSALLTKTQEDESMDHDGNVLLSSSLVNNESGSMV
jgi:hypothetical protein